MLEGESYDRLPSRAKPLEFTALIPLLEAMFDTLKDSANIGDSHTFHLHAVDCADDILLDRNEVAAFTLRKIQALRYAITPGIPTKNSVIVFLAADLNLSLTEMAYLADTRGHADAHDLLIEGRNAINRASRAAAGIAKSEVVILI